MNGSTIPRESDAVVYTYAGPEIAVASTKAFLTQIVAVNLVALYLAQVRGTKWGDEIVRHVEELAAMPAGRRPRARHRRTRCARWRASSLTPRRFCSWVGTSGIPVALEGALKLKELAYMHAEGFPAGELKHGPIALIEQGLPVVIVVPPRSRKVLHDKIVSNIQEIRARGARTIVIAEEGDDTVAPYADTLIRVPAVPTLLQPIVATVPLQVFACELASAKGYDVDQPRNLAKSVTVE